MGLLEVALLLAKYNVTNAVRFAFWTAEEFGLVGSTHYVTSLGDAERKDIALYLNFDMIASPNAGYFILDGDGSAFNNSGPVGSDHIERTFEKFFSEHKLISAPSAFTGRSDYGPFLTVGIPSGGLFTGSDGIMTEEQAKWCVTSNDYAASSTLPNRSYATGGPGVSQDVLSTLAITRHATVSAISMFHIGCGTPKLPRIPSPVMRCLLSVYRGGHALLSGNLH